MFTNKNEDGIKLRNAVFRKDKELLFKIVQGKSPEYIRELIEEAGETSGKTAIHRAIEKLKETLEKPADIQKDAPSSLMFFAESDTAPNFYCTLTAWFLSFIPNIENEDKISPQKLLESLPNPTICDAKIKAFRNPDQGYELRQAVLKMDEEMFEFIFLTQNEGKRGELMHSQGSVSRKTAVHVVCDLLLLTEKKLLSQSEDYAKHFLNRQILKNILARFQETKNLNLNIQDKDNQTIKQLLDKVESHQGNFQEGSFSC